MIIDPQYFHDLKSLSSLDLSAAHLKQHHTTASLYCKLYDQTINTVGTWSALKPNDTAFYTNGTLTGKKHWVSGISTAQWATIAVKEHNSTIIVLVDLANTKIIPAPTLGMEDTHTAHLEFDQTPAIKICLRDDPRCFIIDSQHDLAFITNHVGISQSAFNDINKFTQDKNLYSKKKLMLNLDVLTALWKTEMSNINETNIDQHTFWQHRLMVYAFAKETLINVVNLVTEMTGSGIFEPSAPFHQRFKDALIYSSHFRNLNRCLTELYT